jgi:hypothetical protein
VTSDAKGFDDTDDGATIGARARLAARAERLSQSRKVAPLTAVVRRFVEIDGSTQGGLLAIELFTTIIPLILIGFSYASGFSKNASVGDLFIRQLGIGHPLDTTVRSTFGTASGLQSTWTVFGLIGFLIWGIPMSITVAAMFAKAWRREQYAFGQRLLRGVVWFFFYLAMMAIRERVGFTGSHGAAVRVLFFAASVVPVWIFWSLSPVLLVRDGGRGFKALMLAGLAGVVIDGITLPIASKIVFPALLKGWTGFGPIGVALTLMTWCGVLGVGWVVTACTGAVIWERSAPAETVIASQVDGSDPAPPTVAPA